MWRHLESVDHPNVKSIKNAKGKVLKTMKWKTINNLVDCGIFVMCHMDTYDGQPVTSWECGLSPEFGKGNQQDQLNNLRYKYATKILCDETNIRKGDVDDWAEEFDLDKIDHMQSNIDQLAEIHELRLNDNF